MKLIKKIAYAIVLKDLSKCGLMVGKYDTRNGNDHFMNGIWTVMECIAYNVSDYTGDKFNDYFVKNLVKSEKKAGVAAGGL